MTVDELRIMVEDIVAKRIRCECGQRSAMVMDRSNEQLAQSEIWIFHQSRVEHKFGVNMSITQWELEKTLLAERYRWD